MKIQPRKRFGQHWLKDESKLKIFWGSSVLGVFGVPDAVIFASFFSIIASLTGGISTTVITLFSGVIGGVAAVSGGIVEIGKPQDSPIYGWDNEYGYRQVQVEKRYYTPEEYCQLEETAEYKNEYLDGEIIPMTGEWQVNGRSRVSNFEEVIQLDLRYQENWSLGYDLQLIFKTILILFQKNSGAF